MQTVGEVLRAERERRGISIKDVEKATSIRALYLQAIEEGNYKVAPGEVYLKGFIRNYATFLGLNPQEMMELYRRGLEPEASQPTDTTTSNTAQTAPVKEQSAPPPQTERKSRKEDAAATKTGSSTTKWVVVALVVVAIAGGAWAASNFMGSQSQQPTPPKPSPQAQQPAPVPVTPQPAPATPQAPAAKPMVLVAKYTDECWTEVVADGKTVYEGIPKVGETHTWSATNNITLRLGNAAGLDLTYNGQPQAKLGEKGEVIVKTFTANTNTTQKQ